MIGTRPLRIPNKVLDPGPDTSYRQDMETIERYVNALAVSTGGGASPPFDGIVDFSQTADHSKGIYETPFIAINDLVNNKGIKTPTIAILFRQGIAPGQYVETADYILSACDNIQLIGFTDTPVENPIGWWQVDGHHMDIAGAGLYLQNIDMDSNVGYAVGFGPFINAGILTGLRVASGELVGTVAIGTASANCNHIYLDCWLAPRFDSNDHVGMIEWFGGRWDVGHQVGNTMTFNARTRVVGVRLVSTNFGTITLNCIGTNAFEWLVGTYQSPSELSSGGGQITMDFTGGWYSINLEMHEIMGSMDPVVFNSTVGSPLAFVRLRGSFSGISITGAQPGPAVDIIGILRTGVLNVQVESGIISVNSNKAGHTIVHMLAGEISIGIIDTITTNVTMVTYQDVHVCRINERIYANGQAGTTPYNFDANCAHNIVDVAGASNCVNAGVDNGVGDLIRTT